MSLAHSALLAAQEAAIAANVAASGPTPITRLTFDNAADRDEDTGSQAVSWTTYGTPGFVAHQDHGDALDLSNIQMYVLNWNKLDGKSTATLTCFVNRRSANLRTLVKWGSRLLLRVETDTTLVAMYTGSDSVQKLIYGSTQLTENTWYDVRLTISVADGVKLYVNGALEATVSIAAGFASGSSPDLEIGSTQSDSNYVDDICLYDVVVAP